MIMSPLLSRLVPHGTLKVIDGSGKLHQFGDGTNPQATLKFQDKRLEWQLLLNPQLHFGEAYMDGRLTIEDGTLYDVLDLLTQNTQALDEHSLHFWRIPLARLGRFIQSFNPVARSQRNVAHHYDLSGQLYDLFLDRDRQYSCAYFENPDDDLETAQENKKRHIAAKLLLKPGQKILDIGSGWGGLGLYLAKISGGQVTGVTLSKEQLAVSQQRVQQSGLQDQVNFHLRDYRHETSQYDRIVSVGMFEHVGAAHYVTFFKKIKQILAKDGVLLLHSIGRMEPPGGTNAWLRKYIFPGGYAPALSEVITAVEQAGLWITDIEILRLHYAETLRHWYRRFLANRDRIKALYDERFCRMWEFYLVGCEISFRRMHQMVFQMQITREQDAVPLTRDYIYDQEALLRLKHSGAAVNAA